MKKIILLVLVGMFSGLFAYAVVDPSAVKIKLYAAYIAEQGDCKNPIKIFEDAAGKEFNMMETPELGSGQVEPKAYKCMIMHMGDRVKVTPAKTEGSCSVGIESTMDICQNGTLVMDAGTGSTYTCTGNEDKVFVYLSTTATSENGGAGAFIRPDKEGDGNGMRLQNAIDTSKGKGCFVFDCFGKVDGNTIPNTCSMNPPTFGYRPGC